AKGGEAGRRESQPVTLGQLGIGRMESSRWQQVASVPPVRAETSLAPEATSDGQPGRRERAAGRTGSRSKSDRAPACPRRGAPPAEAGGRRAHRRARREKV